MFNHAFFAWAGKAAGPYHTPMSCSWPRFAPLAALFTGILGCSGSPAEPPADSDLEGLGVVEVTTVTTVQGASGIFLSPRPQQVRPDYVERSNALDSGAVDAPSAELDRAKIDTALLFDGDGSANYGFAAALVEVDAQHFFPAVDGARWPLEVDGEVAAPEAAAWNEWDGWGAYAGLAVRGAPAATLDYERIGMPSPLVLSSEGDDQIAITNRSQESIPKALLVYSHAMGIGIRAVEDLGPGMRKVTTQGPKEGPPAQLLDKARGELEAFFTEAIGAELGAAMARAKSIPFLETPGLRLVYLRTDGAVPQAIGLPEGLGARRRIVLAQAEVILKSDETRALSLLEMGSLSADNVTTELGRFSHAKLELVSLSGDAAVKRSAAELIQTLPE